MTVAAGLLYVTQFRQHCVCAYRRDGTLVRRFGEFGYQRGQLAQPFGIAYGANRLFVAENLNDRICVFQLDGTPAGSFDGIDHSAPNAPVAPPPGPIPFGLAFADGLFYVANWCAAPDRVHQRL